MRSTYAKATDGLLDITRVEFKTPLATTVLHHDVVDELALFMTARLVQQLLHILRQIGLVAL